MKDKKAGQCSEKNEKRIAFTAAGLLGGGVAAAITYFHFKSGWDCQVGRLIVDMAASMNCSASGNACDFDKDNRRDQPLFNIACPSHEIENNLINNASADATMWSTSERAAMGWGTGLGVLVGLFLALLIFRLCTQSPCRRFQLNSRRSNDSTAVGLNSIDAKDSLNPVGYGAVEEGQQSPSLT